MSGRRSLVAPFRGDAFGVAASFALLALVAGCSGGGTTVGSPGNSGGGASSAPGTAGGGSAGATTPSPRPGGASPGSTPAPGSTATAVAETDERSCLWAVDSTEVNTLYPDTNAIYYTATLPIPPGGFVRFDGTFAHARYVSLNVYNPLLEPTDALTDYQIVPAAGSTNPFLAGADRNATARAFSVKLVQQSPPSSPAPNTLYGGEMISSLPVSENETVVIYRVYVPDTGLDATGGVGLPHITFGYANGTTLTGLPLCASPAVLDGKLPNLASIPDAVQDLSIDTDAYQYLDWQKFFNVQVAEAYRAYQLPDGPAVYEGVSDTGTSGGGFASNEDNRYIFAGISESLGNVVAVHATFPTTPRTFAGESPMGTGQMRYWSLCSNDLNLTTVYACIYDEQVQLDAENRGVIAVSMPADRPANAIAACGVTWLDWGTDRNSLLIFRNMLPLPQSQFPYAIQYIPAPPGQNEAAVMGPYYPIGEHMMKSAFEALGCPVSASALPSPMPSPGG